jgi:hypothetical protein
MIGKEVVRKAFSINITSGSTVIPTSTKRPAVPATKRIRKLLDKIPVYLQTIGQNDSSTFKT